MSISGLSLKPDTLILASVYDKISVIAWMLSKDGKTGTNRPESLVKQLTEKPKKDDILTFTSGEAFEKARAKIINGA